MDNEMGRYGIKLISNAHHYQHQNGYHKDIMTTSKCQNIYDIKMYIKRSQNNIKNEICLTSKMDFKNCIKNFNKINMKIHSKMKIKMKIETYIKRT